MSGVGEMVRADRYGRGSSLPSGSHIPGTHHPQSPSAGRPAQVPRESELGIAHTQCRSAGYPVDPFSRCTGARTNLQGSYSVAYLYDSQGLYEASFVPGGLDPTGEFVLGGSVTYRRGNTQGSVMGFSFIDSGLRGLVSVFVMGGTHVWAPWATVGPPGCSSFGMGSWGGTRSQWRDRMSGMNQGFITFTSVTGGGVHPPPPPPPLPKEWHHLLPKEFKDIWRSLGIRFLGFKM